MHILGSVSGDCRIRGPLGSWFMDWGLPRVFGNCHQHKRDSVAIMSMQGIFVSLARIQGRYETGGAGGGLGFWAGCFASMTWLN